MFDHPAQLGGALRASGHLRPQVGDPTVRAEVERELGALLKRINDRVADYEQLKMIVIAKEPFSIENGMLTPMMKVRRRDVVARFKDRLDALYARGAPAVE